MKNISFTRAHNLKRIPPDRMALICSQEKMHNHKWNHDLNIRLAKFKSEEQVRPIAKLACSTQGAQQTYVNIRRMLRFLCARCNHVFCIRPQNEIIKTLNEAHCKILSHCKKSYLVCVLMLATRKYIQHIIAFKILQKLGSVSFSGLNTMCYAGI